MRVPPTHEARVPLYVRGVGCTTAVSAKLPLPDARLRSASAYHAAAASTGLPACRRCRPTLPAELWQIIFWLVLDDAASEIVASTTDYPPPAAPADMPSKTVQSATVPLLDWCFASRRVYATVAASLSTGARRRHLALLRCRAAWQWPPPARACRAEQREAVPETAHATPAARSDAKAVNAAAAAEARQFYGREIRQLMDDPTCVPGRSQPDAALHAESIGESLLWQALGSPRLALAAGGGGRWLRHAERWSRYGMPAATREHALAVHPSATDAQCLVSEGGCLSLQPLVANAPFYVAATLAWHAPLFSVSHMAADDALVHATCGLLCELLRAGDVGALSMALTPIHGAWSAWIVARTLRQVCCALVHELPTASVMAARLQPFVDVVDRIGQCSSTAAASATVSACAMRQAFLDADVMDALAASLPANDGRWLPPHADRSDGPAAATSGDAGLAGDPVLLLHGCLAMRQALRHASAGTHATEAADALTAAERLRDSQTIARCVARGRCGALHALLGAAALPDPVLVAQITGPPTTASLALRFDPRTSPSASPGSGVRSWAQAAHPRCAAARACARVLTLHGYRAPAGQPFRRAWQSAWCSRCADADIEEEDEPAKAEGRRAAVPADRVG